MTYHLDPKASKNNAFAWSLQPMECSWSRVKTGEMISQSATQYIDRYREENGACVGTIYGIQKNSNDGQGVSQFPTKGKKAAK